jgi:hypothetical protein
MRKPTNSGTLSQEGSRCVFVQATPEQVGLFFDEHSNDSKELPWGVLQPILLVCPKVSALHVTWCSQGPLCFTLSADDGIG